MRAMGRLWVKLIKKLGKRPPCVFWTIWKEMNLLVFDNEELSFQRLKNSLYVTCGLGLGCL